MHDNLRMGIWEFKSLMYLLIVLVGTSISGTIFRRTEYEEGIAGSHGTLLHARSLVYSKLYCMAACTRQIPCRHVHFSDNVCTLSGYDGISGNDVDDFMQPTDSIYTKYNPVVASCAELHNLGYEEDGIYLVSPGAQGDAFDVYCELSSNREDGSGEGGWTVFQRRVDSSVDFYRYWADYEEGFGNIQGNYWMGLEKLSRFTSAGPVRLHVYLETFDDDWAYAHYDSFRISDSSIDYTCSVSGYSGTAGDALSSSGYQPADGMAFSTRDRDNDRRSSTNCAQRAKGAWWYKGCHDANLNGQYLGGEHDSYADGINWHQYKGFYYSLKTSIMKIRPR